MANLNQPSFNRQIINRFAMATGVVHSQTNADRTADTIEQLRVALNDLMRDIDIPNGVRAVVTARAIFRIWSPAR